MSDPGKIGDDDRVSGKKIFLDDLKASADTVEEVYEEEGGEVLSGPPHVRSVPRAKVRNQIVGKLLWLLIGMVVLHHLVLAFFVYIGKTDVKAFEAAFSIVLPVITGLLGTAVAFYFKE